MKSIELKELLKDKDISKDEVIEEVTKLINEQKINPIVAKTKSDFEEKSKKALEELNSIKQQSELATKSLELLKKEKEEKELNLNKLTQKYYVVKNVNKDLDDEAINDLIDLASKRTSDKKKFEDAIKEVAEKYNFVAKQGEKPKSGITPTANSNGVNQDPESEKKKMNIAWINSLRRTR